MGVGRRSPAGPLGGNCLDLEQGSALSTPAGATKPYHCLCLSVCLFVSLRLCSSVSLSLCVDVSRPQSPAASHRPEPRTSASERWPWSEMGLNVPRGHLAGRGPHRHLPLLLSEPQSPHPGSGDNTSPWACTAQAWPLRLFFLGTIRRGKHWCPAQGATQAEEYGEIGTETGHVPGQHLQNDLPPPGREALIPGTVHPLPPSHGLGEDVAHSRCSVRTCPPCLGLERAPSCAHPQPGPGVASPRPLPQIAEGQREVSPRPRLRAKRGRGPFPPECVL